MRVFPQFTSNCIKYPHLTGNYYKNNTNYAGNKQKVWVFAVFFFSMIPVCSIIIFALINDYRVYRFLFCIGLHIYSSFNSNKVSYCRKMLKESIFCKMQNFYMNWILRTKYFVQSFFMLSCMQLF